MSLGQPRYGFGTQSRCRNFKNDLPGPGSYNINTTIGPASGVPIYSMPGRRKDLRPKTGVGVPGSNVYNPKDNLVTTAAPQFSVSKNQREKDAKKLWNTPGSGTYHVDAA